LKFWNTGLASKRDQAAHDFMKMQQIRNGCVMSQTTNRENRAATPNGLAPAAISRIPAGFPRQTKID
jgi:hypothetical protein